MASGELLKATQIRPEPPASANWQKLEMVSREQRGEDAKRLAQLFEGRSAPFRLHDYAEGDLGEVASIQCVIYPPDEFVGTVCLGIRLVDGREIELRGPIQDGVTKGGAYFVLDFIETDVIPRESPMRVDILVGYQQRYDGPLYPAALIYYSLVLTGTTVFNEGLAPFGAGHTGT